MARTFSTFGPCRCGPWWRIHTNGPPGAKAGKCKNDQSGTNVAHQMAWRTSVVPRWYYRGQERTKSRKSGCPHVVLQLNETTISTCSTLCGATLIPKWYQRGTTDVRQAFMAFMAFMASHQAQKTKS